MLYGFRVSLQGLQQSGVFRHDSATQQGHQHILTACAFKPLKSIHITTASCAQYEQALERSSTGY